MNFIESQARHTQISVEVCTTLQEIHQCVNLQREIWNDTDEDLTPPAILLVANKIGGHVLLAKDGEKAVGFAFAFPAFRGELQYLHSHIVGVAPAYQGRGLGLQLKLKQRELALAMRISLIEWTFDPLVIRNANFNVVRLGAVMRRFYPNLYGVTPSPLHNGLPTDRLVAEWWLSSSRVDSALAGNVPAPAPDSIQIVVPAEMKTWQKSGSPHAAEVQSRLKVEFQEKFSRGFLVAGFRIENGSGVYLLERQES